MIGSSVNSGGPGRTLVHDHSAAIRIGDMEESVFGGGRATICKIMEMEI